MLSVEWHFVALPLESGMDDAAIIDSMTESASFVPDVIGEYILSFQVSDGALVSSDQVVITVDEQGEAPVSPQNVTATLKGRRVTMVWDAGDVGVVYHIFKQTSFDTGPLKCRRYRCDLSHIQTDLFGNGFLEVSQMESNIFHDAFTSRITSIAYYIVAENEFGFSDISETVVVMRQCQNNAVNKQKHHVLSGPFVCSGKRVKKSFVKLTD